MPKYRVNGDIYNIPEEKVSAFEKRYPNATVDIYDNDGAEYSLPVSEKVNFQKQFKNWSYTAPAAPSAPSAEKIDSVEQPGPVMPNPAMENRNWEVQMGNGHSRVTVEKPEPVDVPIPQRPEGLEPSDDGTAAPSGDVRSYLENANRQQVANLSRDINSRLDEAQTKSRDIYMKEQEDARKGGFLSTLAHAIAASGHNPEGGSGGMSDAQQRTLQGANSELQSEISKLEAAKKAMSNAEEIIAEADKSVQEGKFPGFFKGVARGFGDKLFDVNTWDMGVSDTKNSIELLKALRKYDEGKPLSESEQMLLDAKSVELATNAYFGSYIGRGYKAGAVTAQSLPFMLEMAVNPASTLGESTQSMLARYALSRFAKKGATRAAQKFATKAAGAAGRALGDIAGSAVMAGTSGAVRVAGDAIDRHVGDIETDMDGQGQTVFAGHDPESLAKSIAKAFTSTAIENHSEMLGEYFAPALGIVSKLGRKGMEKFGLKNVVDFVDDVSATDAAKLIADFQKRTKWHGTIGEYAEEVVGNIENAILVGDSTLDSSDDTGVFNLDQNIDTFLGVALMGGVFSTIRTASWRTPKYRARKEMEKARDEAKKKFGDQAWQDIEDRLAEAGDEGMSSVLSEVIIGERNPEREKAILDYAKSIKIYEGTLKGDEKHRELSSPEMTDLESSYENGYTLATPQEVHDAKIMFEYQQARLQQALGMSSIDIETLMLGNEMGKLTEEQKSVALDYLNAEATFDGVIDRVRDDIDNRISSVNAAIDASTNSDTGKLQPARLVDDRAVHIISGIVRLTPDGTMVDIHNSEDYIIIRDDKTGKIESVSPSQIVGVDAEIDPESEKKAAESQIRGQIGQQKADIIDGVLQFNPGDVYNLTNEQGQSFTVQIAADEQGIVDNGDGTINVILNEDIDANTGLPRISQMSKEQIENMAEATNMARLQQYEQQKLDVDARQYKEDSTGRTPENPFKINDLISFNDVGSGSVKHGIVESELTDDGKYEIAIENDGSIESVSYLSPEDLSNMQAQLVQSVEEQEAPEIEQNPVEIEQNPAEIEQPEQPQVSAFERIPKDEQGNPIYEQAETPELAWDAIVEQTDGDEAMAQTVTDGMVADKETALKKVEKAKSKGGATIAEKIAAEKERKAAIEEAKANLAVWKQIAQTARRRKDAEESEKRRIAEEQAAIRKAEEEKLRAEREEAERIKREALNGVPDISDDTPQDARARGYRRVSGHKVDRQEPIPYLQGNDIAVKFSDDVIVPGRVAVIEAETLQPSHIQGTRNPAHFIDESQPKERNDDASVLSARKIARNIRPEEITSSITAYTGAPTTNVRGEVIQGNNRSDALRLIWEGDKEQSAIYKQYLMDHAADFGLNADEISAMNHPVLVNMLDVDDAKAITLGQFVAQDTESGGTERIKPKNVVQKMGADMRTFADMLLASSDDETSFAGLVDRNGDEVLAWMNRRGFITPTQYKSAFDSKGGITAEAKNDLKGIMYQSIFTGGNIRLEEMFNAMPAKAQRAILATAFRDNESPNTERMVKEIQNSIRAYNALSQGEDFANAKNWKEARLAVESWKMQYAMDDVTGESYLPAEKFSNFALHLATMYKGESQSLIQSTFNHLYDLIQGTQEETLFEKPDNTPRTLAQAILETLNFEYDGQQRSNVLAGDSTASQEREQGSTGTPAAGERVEGGEQPADNTGGTENESGSGEVREKIAEEGSKVNTNPSDAQKEAGNYRMGHVKIDGMDVTIENPKGSIRKGRDADGKEWQSEMHNDYGYIRGTKAVDNDHIDIFLSDDPEHGNVYVIDQVDPKTGKFDESKVMYGFSSEQEARDAYLSNYEKGWKGLGKITEVTKEEFKKWIDSSTRKTKPFSEYASVKVAEPQKEKGTPTEVSDNSKNNTSDKASDRGFILMDDFIESALQEAYENRADKSLSRADWNEEDESIEAENKAIDDYCQYIESLSNSGELQKMYDASSIGEQIKMRKSIGEAGYEFKDLIDTTKAANARKEARKKKKEEEYRLKMKNLGIDIEDDDVQPSTKKPLDGKAQKNIIVEVFREWNGKLRKKYRSSPQFSELDNAISIAKYQADEGNVKPDAQKNFEKAVQLIPELYFGSGDIQFSIGKKNYETASSGVKDFAEKYSVSYEAVEDYANGMRLGTGAGCGFALQSIRRDFRLANSTLKFAEFSHEYAKLKQELFDKFGDYDKLKAQQIAEADAKRDAMEAARKRIEEEQQRKKAEYEARIARYKGMSLNELDSEYFKALDNKDEVSARDIVDEIARRNGYADVASDYQGVGAWAAPSRPGGYTDEERRASLETDSPDLSLEDISLGYTMQPDDIFDHPERYMQSDSTSKEAARAIKATLNALNNGNKDAKIKVFRAVPLSVKEGRLRNGDWVTPSRAYADMHGNHRLDGKYRVIEEEVPAKDLWWDGNDVREWGYDDGTARRYANVENNTKLNDVITRDDAGNIIPPSRRFDLGKADERYQISGRKAVNESSEETRIAYEAVKEQLDRIGIPVELLSDQAMREMAINATMLDTALPEDESSFKGTVISSIDGAKILRNLDNAIDDYQNIGDKGTKTFLGDLASALGSSDKDKSSQYATFETKNGQVVTIRISNHNATVSNFDNAGESNGISIVISRKPNEGIANDGDAHIVEFFYPDKALNKADGKPLVEILKSIKQSLYSGEYKDTTGLAQREEVNAKDVPEFMTVYHGSGAKFDRFDHSHMGEGEGAQAYGWGTYVTEVEGIGRAYAKTMAAKYDGKLSKRNLYTVDIPEDIEKLPMSKDEMMEAWKALGNESFFLKFGLDESQAKDAFKALVPAQLAGLSRSDYYWGRSNRNFKKYGIRKRDMNMAVMDKVREMRLANPKKYGFYLNWIGRIDKWIEKLGISEDEYESYDMVDGEDAYHYLETKLGGAKQASDYLSEHGYVGIKYPAQYTSGGRSDGAKNYVIFNENNAKIVDRIEFLREPDGTVYGATVGGKIYLNQEHLNPNTPIHEYTHLWFSALKEANPELYKRGVELMKQLPIWEEVKTDPNYAELSGDDAIASECLSRLVGDRGADKLTELAKKAMVRGDIFGTANRISLIEDFKDWLKKFWTWVRDSFAPWTKEETSRVSVDDIQNMVLSDLAKGVNPLANAREESELKKTNDKFNEQLETFTIETADKYNFNLGRPSSVLLSAGIENKPIRLHGSKVAKKIRKHGFQATALRDLPKAIAHPIAVFDNLGREGNRSILTELKTDNGNVLVSIDLGRGTEVDFNIVSSAFGKNSKGVLGWINGGKMKFVDKEKALNYLHLSAPIAEASDNAELLSAANIVKEFENPSDKERKPEFQFIGEKGAAHMDKVEEATIRLDNLSIARQMEDADKDAKTIKLATGWERGADGKWRYEISDANIKDTIDLGKGISEKRFEEDMLWNSGRLGDVIDAPEIFEAYPQLKDIHIETDSIVNDMPSNGEFNANSNRITIHADRLKYLNSILNHEIQHAIQHIEGFATGGTPEHVEKEFDAAKTEWRARAYAHELEETAKELGGEYNLAEVENALGKEYKELGMEDLLPDKETRIKGANYFARGYADRSMDEAIKRFRLDESTRSDFNSYVEYMHIAGEVEARNVSARLGMTPDERRRTLALETEDVSREDQIILNDAFIGNSHYEEEPEIDRIVREAKENGTYMKAPNGKPTNLNERQWAQVRTRAFKKWFGDWEKAARIEKLRRSEPVIISGQEHEGKYELNRESAKAWMKDNLRGSYENEDTKTVITIGRKGVNKVTSHSMGSEAHLKSIAAIPEMLMKAIFITREQATKAGAQYPEYEYYVVGIKIGDVDYTAKVTIGVDENGNKFYDHALTEIEKGKLLDQKNGQAAIPGFISTEINPSVTKGKDTKLFSILQTNSSKIVDENGEPKVVYHGSPFRFFRFDKTKLGQSTGADSAKEGFFFTDNKELAELFSRYSLESLPVSDVEQLVKDRLLNMSENELNDAYEVYRNDSPDYLDYADETDSPNDRDYLEIRGFLLDGVSEEEAKREYIQDSIESKIEGGYFSDMEEVEEELSSIGIEFGNNEQVFLNIESPLVDEVERDYFHNGEDVSPMTPVLQNAKRMGRDGVVFTGIVESGQKGAANQYVAFEPNQIKSATDNVGTFDGEQDDIRYRDSNRMDAEYMSAIESGDMRKAGRMVEAAFRKAFPGSKVKNVVYHGVAVSEDGKQFPYNSIREGHFTDDEGFAEYYAGTDGYVYKVFLDIESPLEQDFRGQNSDFARNAEGNDVSTRTFARQARESNGKYDGAIITNVDEYGDGIEADGVGNYDGSVTDYIPVSADQIYSAEPVVYDDNGQVIPLSRRFENGNPDIRYKHDETGNGNRTSQDIEAAATKLAESLGEKVRLVRDVNEIENQNKKVQENQRKSKGWFNTDTREIVVVLPNATGIEDVQATILHEAVGHKGLRELVGDDRFDDFLDKVYAAATKATRLEIVSLARRNHWDFRLATEEYIAGLAENGFAGRENRTLFEKIKDFFRDMLSRAKIALGVNIGDNELRYMLWRTYQMRTSRGILAKAEDISMQQSMNVGNFREDNSSPVSFLKQMQDNAETLVPRQLTKEIWDNEIKGKVFSTPIGVVKLGENQYEKNIKKGRELEFGMLIPTIERPDAIFEEDAPETGAERQTKYVFVKSFVENGVKKINYASVSVRKDGMEVVASSHYLRDKQMLNKIEKERMLWNRFASGSELSAQGGSTAQSNALSHDANLLKGVKKTNSDEEILSGDDSRLRFRTSANVGSSNKARDIYEEKTRVIDKNGRKSDTANLMRRLKEAYVDSMQSLKYLQDAISEETGKPVEDFENAYLAENSMSSKNKAQTDIYLNRFFNPIKDAIRDLQKEGAEYGDIVRYLMAKHGLERNEVFSKRDAEKDGGVWDGSVRRDYSGLTELTRSETDTVAPRIDEITSRAEDIVRKFEMDHDTDVLWEKINDATKDTLRTSYITGMLTKDNYEMVRSMFRYYIPLRGWSENTASAVYDYLSDARPKTSSIVKAATGRTTISDDPIATIAYMGQSAIIQGNRNMMKQKLLNLALNHKTGLLTVNRQWEVQDPVTGEWITRNPVIPVDATPEEVADIVSQFETDMKAAEKNGTARISRGKLDTGKHITAYEGQEHVVKVKRGGIEYCIYLNGNPRAAQAVNGMTNPDAVDSWLIRKARVIKNFMARMFTSQNPAFIISNLSRDVIFAGTAVFAKENSKYTALYTKNIARALAKGQLIGLVHRFETGRLDDSKDIDRYFGEFIRNGGETGFTQLNTVDDFKRDLNRFAKEMKQGQVMKVSSKVWNGIWDGVEFMNRCAEDATRFSVYMTSRQMGRSVERSISDAKEITVNFNRKGSGGFGARVMNFAYIFFNAAIQALANAGKIFYEHPVKSAVALSTFSAAGFLAPLLAQAIISAFGGDDDAYWDLPEWVRRNNFVFYVPWSDNKFLIIPISQELRPFYALGEVAMSVLMGKEDVLEGLRSVGGSFMDLLPVDFMGNGNNLAVSLTPTVAQPFAQLVANSDYFGKPIYRRNDYNRLDPAWTKAYKGTSSMLINASKWLNEVTGGDDVKRGWIDPVNNPAVIEHLFESYLGGVGKTINKTAKTISMIWNPEMRDIRNVPIVSTFVQESDDERVAGSQLNREYVKAMEEFRETEHTISGYKRKARMGSMEYADKLSDFMNTPEFKKYSKMKGYASSIAKLRTALKKTEELNGDVMDAEYLQEMLLELKQQMLEELKED